MTMTRRPGDKLYIVVEGIPPIYQEVIEGSRHRIKTVASPLVLIFRGESPAFAKYAGRLEKMTEREEPISTGLYRELKNIKDRQEARILRAKK